MLIDLFSLGLFGFGLGLYGFGFWSSVFLPTPSREADGLGGGGVRHEGILGMTGSHKDINILCVLQACKGHAPSVNDMINGH
jgi:hypothetical protein